MPYNPRTGQFEYGTMRPPSEQYDLQTLPDDLPIDVMPGDLPPLQQQTQSQTPVIDAPAMGMPPGQLTTWLEQIHRIRGEEIAALQQRAAEARMQSQNAFGQLQQASQEPQPQLGAGQSFIANLMGNLSQALSPRMGGQRVAEETQGLELNRLQSARTERMRLLADQYGRLADQAEKMGNLETAATMNQRSQKMMEALHLHMQAEGIRARNAGSRQNAETNAREKRFKEIMDGIEAEARSLDTQAGNIEKVNLKKANKARGLRAARLRANAAWIRQKAGEMLQSGEFSPFERDILPSFVQDFIQRNQGMSKRDLLQLARRGGDVVEYGIGNNELMQAIDATVPDDESMLQPSSEGSLMEDAIRVAAPAIGRLIPPLPTTPGLNIRPPY